MYYSQLHCETAAFYFLRFLGLTDTMLLLHFSTAFNSIVKLLRRMSREGLKWLEVTAAAQAAFNAEVQRRLKGSVWLSGGCGSWYLNNDGKGSSGTSMVVAYIFFLVVTKQLLYCWCVQAGHLAGM
jgi:hypothetical protein